MARTKLTPRNPNIDRPVAAIGSDIQSTKRRPTPKPTLEKVLGKGGKQPGSTYPRSYCTWVS